MHLRQQRTLATRHSHDALIAGRIILPRHISHIPDPHYKLTRVKPPIKFNNIQIKNLHNRNSTKSNRMQLTRSMKLLIFIHFSLQSTCIHKRFVEKGGIRGYGPSSIFAKYIIICKVYF